MTATGVDVFAEMACPFTHVGLRRFVAARDERGAGVPVRVHAWPLEWVNGRPLDATVTGREIEALRSTVAPDLFVGFDPATYPQTSIPAYGLAASAYTRSDAIGEAVSLALRDAIFEEGRDVADPGVLRDLGARFGVAPCTFAEAEEAARVDWNLGRALSVVGSPHFFVGTRNWFCPALVIAHDNGRYEVDMNEESVRAFHDAALA